MLSQSYTQKSNSAAAQSAAYLTVHRETLITNLSEHSKTMVQKVASHNPPLGTKIRKSDKGVTKSLVTK